MKVDSSATVFRVTDIETSKRYYIDVLGFDLDFEFEHYIGVKHGNVNIHLAQVPAEANTIGAGSAYLFCDEITDYYERIVSKGCQTRGSPTQTAFGLLDFQAVDPDGNLIAFGCPLH